MGSQELDTTERLSLSHGRNPTISMKHRQEIIAQDHAHLPHVSSFLQERILVHGILFVCLFSFFGFFVLAAPHGMWDFSSPTRDQTHGPCIGSAES